MWSHTAHSAQLLIITASGSEPNRWKVKLSLQVFQVCWVALTKWTQCKTMTQQYSLPTCTKLIWNIQDSEIHIVKNIIENTVTVYLDNDGEAWSMTFTKPTILSPENKATQYICETETFLRWVWKFLCKGMLRLLYSKRLHE